MRAILDWFEIVSLRRARSMPCGPRSVNVGRLRSEELPDERLHPDGQGVDALLQIVSERGSVPLVVKNRLQPPDDSRATGVEEILRPVERLDDSHRRVPCPVEPARGGGLKANVLVAELNGT